MLTNNYFRPRAPLARKTLLLAVLASTVCSTFAAAAPEELTPWSPTSLTQEAAEHSTGPLVKRQLFGVLELPIWPWNWAYLGAEKRCKEELQFCLDWEVKGQARVYEANSTAWKAQQDLNWAKDRYEYLKEHKLCFWEKDEGFKFLNRASEHHESRDGVAEFHDVEKLATLATERRLSTGAAVDDAAGGLNKPFSRVFSPGESAKKPKVCDQRNSCFNRARRIRNDFNNCMETAKRLKDGFDWVSENIERCKQDPFASKRKRAESVPRKVFARSDKHKKAELRRHITLCEEIAALFKDFSNDRERKDTELRKDMNVHDTGGDGVSHRSKKRSNASGDERMPEYQPSHQDASNDNGHHSKAMTDDNSTNMVGPGYDKLAKRDESTAQLEGKLNSCRSDVLSSMRAAKKYSDDYYQVQNKIMRKEVKKRDSLLKQNRSGENTVNAPVSKVLLSRDVQHTLGVDDEQWAWLSTIFNSVQHDLGAALIERDSFGLDLIKCKGDLKSVDSAVVTTVYNPQATTMTSVVKTTTRWLSRTVKETNTMTVEALPALATVVDSRGNTVVGRPISVVSAGQPSPVTASAKVPESMPQASPSKGPPITPANVPAVPTKNVLPAQSIVAPNAGQQVGSQVAVAQPQPAVLPGGLGGGQQHSVLPGGLGGGQQPASVGSEPLGHSAVINPAQQPLPPTLTAIDPPSVVTPMATATPQIGPLYVVLDTPKGWVPPATTSASAVGAGRPSGDFGPVW